MADIDDELLALAGGGESSDEEEVMSEIEIKERSATPPPPKKKETAPKAVKKTPVKKARRRAKQDESEEEGEASSAPSTPNSLESAPMDESDSDMEPQRGSDGKEGQDDEKYPVDGVFMSQVEKAEIMALPELRREEIIAERVAEAERSRQNRLLRQLVSVQETEEKKQQSQLKKKRSADAAELEDSHRKSSRARTRLDGTKVGETSAGIDSLRRARAEKSDRKRRREEERLREQISPGSNRSHDRDRADSEDWLDERPSRSPEKDASEQAPPELRDFERVRAGRRQFGERCFDPGFEQALVGCYVRISMGNDTAGQPIYRMAVIKGFNTGRPYAMAGPSGLFVTDLYAVTSIGKASRDQPFIYCSDSALTEAELHRFKMFCQQDQVSMPKKSALEKKVRDINAFISRALTDEEVSVKINRKKELRRPFDPVIREKARQEIEDAKATGKSAALISRLEEEYDAMLSKRLAFGTSLKSRDDDRASKPLSQQDRLAEVNRANRKANIEAVRRAQIAEKKAAREAEGRAARGEAVAEDRSRRLKTVAKFVYNPEDEAAAIEEKKKRRLEGGDSGANSGASTPANGTPRLKPQKQALLPHLARLQERAHAEKKGGMPTIHKPLMDDDIIGAIDMEIDVEID